MLTSRRLAGGRPSATAFVCWAELPPGAWTF